MVSVSSVQPNFVYRSQFVPNDPSYILQWHLPAVGAPAAWEFDAEPPAYGGDPGTVVAVLDTGVAFETYAGFVRSPEFSNVTFVPGTDIVNNDSHPNDDVGHGTHVAAIIAQDTNNGSAGASLGFNLGIMPVKVLDETGTGSTLDIAAGIDFAVENGADVINLSLGGTSGDGVLLESIQAARNAGVVIVAAAGNTNQNAVYYPARYPGVIGVGSVRYDDTRAPYSNYGTGLDLVAPGGDLDVDQNNDGQPDGILQTTCVTSACAAFAQVYYEGTSQATPLVSAAAGLLLSAGISPDDVELLLSGTAEDLGVEGFDSTFGWGRLDIAAALEVAIDDQTSPTGTIALSHGSDFTRSLDIPIEISATDTQSRVLEMALSNTPLSEYHWQPYTSILPHWDLGQGVSRSEGTKRVYAAFRDTAGNISTTVSDTIRYDATAPGEFGLTVHAPEPNQRVRLRSGVPTAVRRIVAEWSQASDSISGVVGYRVKLSPRKDEILDTGGLTTQRSFIGPLMSSGRTLYLHVAAVDAVGRFRQIKFEYVYQPMVFAVATQTSSPKIYRQSATGKTLSQFGVYGRGTVGASVARLIPALGTSALAISPGPGGQTMRIVSPTGTLVRAFRPYTSSRPEYFSVATGNVGGDDRTEIISSPSAGNFPARLFDSQGVFVREFWPFGRSFTGGFESTILATKSGPRIVASRSGSTTFRVMSPKGVKMFDRTAFRGSEARGLSLASGDINGDGQDELLVAPKSGRGIIKIFSANGSLLRTIPIFSIRYQSGLQIASGDRDGNGSAEIIAAPTSGTAHIQVFDGIGRRLYSYFARPTTYRGGLKLTTLP